MNPLLRRANLLPGESLPSLIERLTQLNYYNAGTIGGLCQSHGSYQSNIDYVTQPKSASTFFQLAQLTLINPEDLFAASKHFFAPAFYAPQHTKNFMTWLDGTNRQLLTGAIASRKIRPSYVAQFCPMCLRESYYHRLAWMPVASSICLQHKCLLLDHCPTCLKSVTVPEIVRHQCKICKTDIAQSTPIFANDHELGILSQQVIQFWLSIAPAPTLPLNHTLPERSVVHSLLWERLCMSLLACQADWPDLPSPLSGLHRYIPKAFDPRKRLSPEQAYYLYAKAFAGILNWPHGFYDFLDAYGQRNSKAHWSLHIMVRLGGLGHWFCKIWQQPEFTVIQQVLRKYLVEKRAYLPYFLPSIEQ